MKTRNLMLALMVVAAQTVSAGTVAFDVTVADAKSDAGKALVRISATEKQFDGKEAPVREMVADVKGGKVALHVEGLPAGRYAITVVHDVNANGKLDSNMMGMPTEPFGFSNNPVIRFGPPDFEDAVVTIAQDAKIEIHLVTMKFGR
jgi:uncharacterized protein (DUF2141 family)